MIRSIRGFFQPALPGMNMSPFNAGYFENQSKRPIPHALWVRWATPHMVTRGEGFLRTRDAETRLRPGDVFCVFSNDFVEYGDDAEAPWGYYWLSLEGSAAESLLVDAGFDRRRPWFHARDPEALIGAWERMLSALQEIGAATPPHFVLARVLELVGEIHRQGDAVKRAPPPPPPLLQQAEQIFNSAMPPPNIEGLADVLGVHRGTLYNAFIHATGSPPIAWLRAHRHEHAKRLLVETDMKVEAVAAAAGYGDAKYFHRAFRELEGMTPAAYRRQWH